MKFSNKGAEASEIQVKQALPRSSKRSRAAEIHNLSEKVCLNLNVKIHKDFNLSFYTIKDFFLGRGGEVGSTKNSRHFRT